MLETHPIGLDFETVGGSAHPGDSEDKDAWAEWSRSMHPKRGGHVRLIQLSFHDEPDQIIDLYAEGLTLADLKDELEANGPYVCHNAGFEQLFLRDAGIRVTTYDTMLLDAMLRTRATGYEDEVGIRMYRKLDDVATDHLGEQKAGDEQSSDWSQALTQQQYTYAMKDAVLVRDMWPRMIAGMPSKFHPGVEMMMEAIGPTAEVNLHGLRINPAAHQVLIDELRKDATNMKFELIGTAASPTTLDAKGKEQPFNPASGKQVSEMIVKIMEETIGDFWRATVPWATTANGQLNLNKTYVTYILGTVEKYHPPLASWLAARIRWRGKQKLVEAFGPTLTTLTDLDDMVRGEYKQHGAVTGRYSCARPNLQQIPSKTDARFRTLFVAPPGRKYVIADFSQIELRIAGLASNDPHFDQIFRDGLDIHTQTASAMFNTPSPSDTQRKAAKAVNFGVLFGATAPTIALSSGFSHGEAEQFLTAWLGAYPTYAEWMPAFNKQSKLDGEFSTAGQRRILVDPDAATTKLKNYPIQASAADALYHSLIYLDQAIHDANIDAKIVALIHDEFIIDSAPAHATQAGEILVASMVKGLQACYPDAFVGDLVDAAVVDTWAEKP